MDQDSQDERMNKMGWTLIFEMKGCLGGMMSPVSPRMFEVIEFHTLLFNRFASIDEGSDEGSPHPSVSSQSCSSSNSANPDPSCSSLNPANPDPSW